MATENSKQNSKKRQRIYKSLLINLIFVALVVDVMGLVTTRFYWELLAPILIILLIVFAIAIRDNVCLWADKNDVTHQ